MKPGDDVLAGGVDDGGGGRAGQAADGDDAAVLHRDVGGEPGIAAAVEHAAVADEQIERRGRLPDAEERAGRRSPAIADSSESDACGRF